jgi:hypothetical protein
MQPRDPLADMDVRPVAEQERSRGACNVETENARGIARIFEHRLTTA